MKRLAAALALIGSLELSAPTPMRADKLMEASGSSTATTFTATGTSEWYAVRDADKIRIHVRGDGATAVVDIEAVENTGDTPVNLTPLHISNPTAAGKLYAVPTVGHVRVNITTCTSCSITSRLTATRSTTVLH